MLKNKSVKKLVASLLLFVWLLTQNITAKAQLITEKIAKNNNSYTETYGITSDTNGYIYIGTNNGLYFYNGNNTQIINYTEYLSFINYNDNIWAMPFNGFVTLIEINQKSKTYFLPIQKQQRYTILGQYINKNNNICLLNRDINYNTNSIEISPQGKILKIKDCTKPEFYINFVSEKIKDTNNEAYKKLIRELAKGNIENLRIVNNSLIALFDRLYEIKNGTITEVFNLKKSLCQHANIQNIFELKDKSYLVCVTGSHTGVYIYKNNTFKKIFTNNYPTCAIKDVFNNIWISTLKDGLYKISAENMHNYTCTLLDNNVGEYKQDVDSNSYYIKDNTNSLWTINNNALKPVVQSTELDVVNRCKINYGNTDTACYLNNKYLYVLVKGKIYKKIPHDDFFFKTNIGMFVKNKQLITIGKSYVQAQSLNANNLLEKNSVVSNSRIFDYYQLSDSVIILSSSIGIQSWNMFNNTIRPILTSTVTHDEFKKIVPTVNGFCLYGTRDTIKQYALNNGVAQLQKVSNSNNNIYNKLYSYKNYYLAISNVGFRLLDTNFLLIKNYTVQTLTKNEIISTSHLINNKLLFETEGEIFKINVDSFIANNLKAKCYLQNVVSTNNKKISLLDTTITCYNNTQAMLNFDFFNTNETKENITYTIQNSNFEIIASGKLINNALQFKQLGFDKHILKIYYNNNALKTFIIKVERYWYQNIFINLLGWIIIIYGLALAGYLYAQRQISKRTLEQEKNAYILKLKSSARLNQLKPHFIFNALTPLQKYIYKSNVTAGLNYLNTFTSLIRTMLTNSELEYCSLEAERDFLKKYIEVRQHEAHFGFQYAIICNTTETNWNNITIPTLLIQPLVENAINYGISNLQNNDGKLNLIFTIIENKFLQVILQDNGEGYNLPEKLKSNNLHSINIINERLKIINNSKVDQLKANYTEDYFEVKFTIPLTLKT